ncbi:hypothetical protein BAUCODRAFT_433000 [Baudoinia panamericana UAMH 10762]|uniref:Subtelomeric hrmA-associated cluster protein AFUB-079030/YDR124W-like helical bundle domain-containing protein n=1 Tax=Baudoinia panamericana (strain UAMH 10762) TaxID=717646 RepID=M2MZ94_BAUPA|nr:uncharacterized protein BAUCODRAFT_433000 [Baudoinia panamericana UAMH 10762]EMC96933.1 hypothetical protein BAUCODRAFT_433000 [Baudoinia panamericana UAMH 10762]
MVRRDISDGALPSKRRADKQAMASDLRADLEVLRAKHGEEAQAIALYMLTPHGEVTLTTTGHVLPSVEGTLMKGRTRLREALDVANVIMEIDHGSQVGEEPCLAPDGPGDLTFRKERRAMPNVSQLQLQKTRLSGGYVKPAEPYQVRAEVSHPPDSERVLPAIAPPGRLKAKSFRIDDEAAVTAFLHDRFSEMQQLSDKRIAKVWIKGICPKKQAKFPYQNTKREKRTGEKGLVPGWWPDTNVCPFTEPDHIRKEQRNELLVHILRLRPTPEQLKTMNNDTCEAYPTYAVQSWTQFLKELCPVTSLDDLSPSTPARIKMRQRLFEELYGAAEMEEDFKTGGRDGSSRYYYSDGAGVIDKKAPRAKRRRREPSSGASVALDSCSQSGSSSSSEGRQTKRPCCDADTSRQASVAARDHLKRPERDDDAPDQRQPERRPTLDHETEVSNQPRIRNGGAIADHSAWSETHDIHPLGGLSINMQWQSVPHDASPGLHHYQQPWTHPLAFEPLSLQALSAQPGSFDAFQAHYGGGSQYPGNHDYSSVGCGPRHYQQQQAPVNLGVHDQSIQAYRLTDVPQPCFDNTADTPLFSPTSSEYPGGYPHDRTPGVAHMATDMTREENAVALQALQLNQQYLDDKPAKAEQKPHQSMFANGHGIGQEGSSTVYNRHPMVLPPHLLGDTYAAYH